MDLHFHSERTVPLSDILYARSAIKLTSCIPVKLNVSVMTSRGLAHFETITLTTDPYELLFEPPWGKDWSVLQIQASEPRATHEEPFTIHMRAEKIDRPVAAKGSCGYPIV